MVRIIAPACPRCGSTDVEIQEMYALFEDKQRLDPIDINLAHWVVGFICWGCKEPFAENINDVKAGLGLRT